MEGLEQKGWRVRTEEQSDELVSEANNPSRFTKKRFRRFFVAWRDSN
jgi:hypothetical protein